MVSTDDNLAARVVVFALARFIAISLALFYTFGFVWFLGSQDPLVELLIGISIVSAICAAMAPRKYLFKQGVPPAMFRVFVVLACLVGIGSEVVFAYVRMTRFNKELSDVIGVQTLLLVSFGVMAIEMAKEMRKKQEKGSNL